jgi:hypothetical protein
MAGRPRAPKGSGPEAKRFMAEITAAFDFNPAEVAILRRICRLLDRLAEIDVTIESMSAIAKGRGAPGAAVLMSSSGVARVNPAFRAANETERELSVLIKQLGIPEDATGLPGDQYQPASVTRIRQRRTGRPGGL